MEEKKKVFTSTDVRNAEIKRISDRRRCAGYKDPNDVKKTVGLALSGGGIRSATFNLGILQALERCGLLRCIDYMSTVSGGGYIGSSLTWFMSRLKNDQFPFNTVNRETDTFTNKLLAQFRESGKYLTPGDGLTWWSLIAAMLIGIIINLIVIIPVFFFILWILGINVPRLPLFTNQCVFKPPFYQYMKPTFFTAVLFVGLLAIVGVIAAGVLFALTTRLKHVRKSAVQRWTNKWMGNLLMWGIFLVAIGSIPIITEFIKDNLFKWAHSVMSSITLAGIISICGGLFGRKHGNESKGIRSVLLYLGLGLLMYGVFLWLNYIRSDFSPAVYIVGLIFSMLIAFCADINHVSMHRFYRNRLREVYMPVTLRDNQGHVEKLMDNSVTPPTPAKEQDADLCFLHEISQTKAPYHIVNTTVQTVGSKLPKLKERGGDNFIFTPLFCGSNATSYLKSQDYIKGKMNLATAVAISGAAVDPNTYATRSRPLAFLMTLLNVRLGYWIRNPYTTTHDYKPWRNPFAFFMTLFNVLLSYWTRNPNTAHDYKPWRNPSWYRIFGEMLGSGLDERSLGIHLSDGGHFENLGLYELIRRECEIIIVCDAGSDINYFFDDLSKAIELVRTDFGAEIILDTRPIRPHNMKKKISSEACVCGVIQYMSGLIGTLVYINTTLVKELTEDIYGYQRKHPAFPDQGTGNQFFNEQQFEAYRELGLQLGIKYFSKLTKHGEPLDILDR